jgi:hypothetical protein
VGTATTGDTATTEVMAVTAGATAGVAGTGAEDMDTDGAGAGELGLGGRIGVGDGAIRTAIITAPGIIPLEFIILTRTTALRTIPRAILILATGPTILRQQIRVHGLCPTRTDRQNPGDHRYREARPT